MTRSHAPTFVDVSDGAEPGSCVPVADDAVSATGSGNADDGAGGVVLHRLDLAVDVGAVPHLHRVVALYDDEEADVSGRQEALRLLRGHLHHLWTGVQNFRC